MSAPPSKIPQPAPTTFNERLNEQLINCLNIQTNVIQNLSQYSQHISLQLFEIKSIVEILSNRVLALQQQQQSHFTPNPYPPSYYPNYMSQPPMPVAHPPVTTHHPPTVPFPVQQQPQPPIQIRPPITTALPLGPTFPFVPTTTVNSSVSLHSSTPLFQFSAPSAVLSSPGTTTNVLSTTATTTTTTASPLKSLFSNPPKFGTTDSTTTTTTKPPSLFPNTINTTVATSTTTSKPSIANSFTFGNNSSVPIFGIGNLTGGLSSIATVKPETHADDEGEGGGVDDSYEPNDSFKPIVHLKAVEVETGEEQESVLFCERAKLYRFDIATNQMKERGIGEMKILQHKTNETCRILMRREQVLKICANHRITSQMELKSHNASANAYLWSAMDFADGESKHETLCVRFKTEEQAKNFLKVFNEAKEINSKKTGDLPSIESVSLNDQTKTNTNDDDVVSIGEVKPSAEQIDRATKLQLPSTFFLYENKEPCKGCPGCENDTPSIVSDENKAITKNTTNGAKTDAKTTNLFQTQTTKTPLSSSENIKFSFGNPEKQQLPLQKQSSVIKDEKQSVESSSPVPTSTTSQNNNQPSALGNPTNTTSLFRSTTPVNNVSAPLFGAGASLQTNSEFSFPGFGSTTTAAPSSNGFNFSSPTTNSTTNTATFSFGAAIANANQSLFGNSPKISFTDLAKQSPTIGEKSSSNGTEPRVFAGQGSLIFGTNAIYPTTKTANHEEDEGDGGGDDDSYEPNVSFKPIVQLSAVEVKTGEEDEDVLFCERAKLYRFDVTANQMKERGIGEMKILQHKTTKHCRIVMRREQVLKLCANHQLTSNMTLKPHQGSANAYLWSAMDFSEGEAKHETLCIRFKTDAQAKSFLKVFNEAKEVIASTS